jgi:RNA polymerase sigma factor (sigma-70 family)
VELTDNGVTFAELYERERAVLVRLAYLVVGAQSVAEDIVHEAFIAMWRRWSTIEMPAAYARTTVMRRAVRVRRRRSKELEIAQRTPAPTVATEQAAGDPAVWAALGALPARQRAALVLRFYDDCDHETIGQLLGCSAANARVLVHRGLSRLRKEMS